MTALTSSEKEAIALRDAADYSPGTPEASARVARAIEDRHDLLVENARLEEEVSALVAALSSALIQRDRLQTALEAERKG